MTVHVSIGLVPTPPPHNGCLSHEQRGQLSPGRAQTVPLWSSGSHRTGSWARHLWPAMPVHEQV